MKVQVKLFLAGKVNKLQEQQLFNMLDAVPDQVMICSTDRSDTTETQPLYNNLQMRQFFGSDVVSEVKNALKEKSKAAIEGDQTRKVRRRSRFYKRIFKDQANLLQENDDGPIQLEI